MSKESSRPSAIKSFDEVKSNSGRIRLRISINAVMKHVTLSKDIVNQTVRCETVMSVLLDGRLVLRDYPKHIAADPRMRIEILLHQARAHPQGTKRFGHQ